MNAIWEDFMEEMKYDLKNGKNSDRMGKREVQWNQTHSIQTNHSSTKTYKLSSNYQSSYHFLTV